MTKDVICKDKNRERQSANTQEKRRKSEVLLQKFSENPKYYFKNSAKI